MNVTGKPSGAEPTDGPDLMDPRQAAALLEQTSKRAEQEFSPVSPPLLVAYALVFLIGFGAIWWSVRDQQPYSGPTPAAIGVLYLVLAFAILTAVIVAYRATGGVGGRASRERRYGGVATAAGFVGAYLLQFAMRYDGVSYTVVYGIYPAVAPLMVVAAVWAGGSAAREDRWQLAGAVAMVVACAAAAFAGPVGVWAVMAVLGFVALVSAAGGQTWMRRG